MRALLRSMAPTTFEHVSAVLALYRPGPMSVNMHNDYADRVNDRQEVSYFHPDAREVLGDTYGLMIYQESVMRVAQKFAGYSLAEADNLRKACGKKIRELMAKERESFEVGCERTGYGRDLGKQLFDVIEKFADYAFNKSHTFGYGLITYQTAYLKAHYPVEYMACLLTSVKDKLDKMAVYLADARAAGIKVLTPDINRSLIDFAALDPADVPIEVELPPNSPGAIPFGLSAIRNVGEGLVEQLLRERSANGPFGSFYDFAERVPEQVLNKRTVESLIKAGAFDSLGHPRKGLLAVFEQIIDTTVARRRQRDQGVMSLFGDLTGDDDIGFDERAPISTAEFERAERLRFEKEMLGLYVSDHPLSGVEGALRRKTDCSIAEAADREDGAVMVLGGLITGLARKYTKKGDQMAVFILEDLESSIEVTVFPRTLVEIGHKLVDDGVVTIKGRLDKRDESRVGFNVLDISVLDMLDVVDAPPLRLRVPATSLTEGKVRQIKGILSDHPGASPVFLHLGQGKVLRLGDEFRVDLDRAVGELRMALGHDAVVL
jgi:DNA polymerase-3 subunit alpha